MQIKKGKNMKLYDLIPQYSSEFDNIDVAGITSDSRKVKDGYIFVCIKGPNRDGHDYAFDAIKAGAALVVCEQDLGFDNQIITDDSLKDFYIMCSAWFDHPEKKLKLFGVTGTNGKTTVSYMLKNILESAGHKVGLIGTIQNIIGDRIVEATNTTPGMYELYEMLSQMVNEGCDCCVMEVSSHALDQRRVLGLQFEVGMFTNLTQDHLDYHKTMEAYLDAKKKLFDISKTAVLNYDDQSYNKIVEDVKIPYVSYSIMNNEARFTAKDVRYRPDHSEFYILVNGKIERIKVATAGKFNVPNALCAMSAAICFGIDVSVVANALANMSSVSGRCESVNTGKDFSVIIDYAHTPDGLANILKTFSDYEKNRLIVLFGCGGNRDKTKRSQMGEIAALNADFVIVTSDNPRNETPEDIIDDIMVGVKKYKTPHTVIVNREEAIKFAIQNAQKGDIIILAGKGHETYQILESGKIHFDEREIVLDALNNSKE